MGDGDVQEIEMVRKTEIVSEMRGMEISEGRCKYREKKYIGAPMPPATLGGTDRIQSAFTFQNMFSGFFSCSLR